MPNRDNRRPLSTYALCPNIRARPTLSLAVDHDQAVSTTIDVALLPFLFQASGSRIFFRRTDPIDTGGIGEIFKRLVFRGLGRKRVITNFKN